MRLLLDENLSPVLCNLLIEAGYEAAHVRDLGLVSATDEVVIERAVAEKRVLISADTDFGTLLARTAATAPSFVLIRRVGGRRAGEQALLLTANLPVVAADLDVGAIVALGEETILIRRLPI